MTHTSGGVLVVDKHEATCDQLCTSLIRRGYAPISFNHPRKVLELLDTTEPSIPFSYAFINTSLPRITGPELAKYLLSNSFTNHIVYLRSKGAIDPLLEAIKTQDADFLPLPFAQDDLFTLLDTIEARLHSPVPTCDVPASHLTLIENLPLLVFSLGRDYSLNFLNRTSHPMLGFSVDEALSTPGWFPGRINTADRTRVLHEISKSFESGRPCSIECTLMHRKGRPVHGILRTIPAAANTASRKWIEAVFIDITDRIFLEKSLIQNERLKTLGAISAEVAHEIRNPLMSIAGFARRLEKKIPDAPEVGIILRESNRLEKLLGRIRDYLRPIKFQHQPCSLNTILVDCLNLLFAELGERQVWAEVDIDEGLPRVTAAPEILSQVFINIMRNSLRLLEKGDVLFIKAFGSEGNVHVEFKHRLPETSNLKPETIFLPFDEQEDEIGLPLASRLVKGMGGVLSYSTDAGQAYFIVSVPKHPRTIDEEMEASTRSQDMTESEKYCFDSTSDTLSRPRFDDLFTRMLRTGIRNTQPLSLLMVQINAPSTDTSPSAEQTLDTLQRMAAHLGERLEKPWHLMTQYGESTFAVLMPNTTREQAIDQARRIMCAVSLRPSHNSDSLPECDPAHLLNLSIGITTTMPTSRTKPAMLVASANRAMFQAMNDTANPIAWKETISTSK